MVSFERIMNYTNYNLKVHIPKNSFTDILIVSPGISGGQENILIQHLCDVAIKENIAVVTWDFSFFVTGGNIDKDKDISELENVIIYIKKKYPKTRIHLAGKSYGGLISSLVDSALFESLCVFGLLKEFEGLKFKKPVNKPFFVIHGTRDKFFTIESIKDYLGSDADLFVVKDGDHGLGDMNFNFIDRNSLEWYITKLKLFVNKNVS